MLWGFSLQAWQTAVFWLWATAAGAGALAVAASFGSSVISYYISEETQTAANKQIAAANESAGKANEAAGKANERAGKATEKAAELQLSVEQEKTRRLKLQQQMAWRRLSPNDRRILIESLKGNNFEVWVSTVGKDPEASLFHQEIYDTLNAAGLKAKWFNGYERATGFIVSEQDSEQGKVIVSAFNSIGIQASQKSGDGMPGLEIVIGTKPEPVFDP